MTAAGADQPRRTKVFVLLRHGLDPEQWRKRRAEGLAWDDTPYGYDLAEEFFDLEWSRDAAESRSARRRRERLQRWLGFDWIHVWRNRRGILNADVVWTHTEREHLAVAVLRILRRGRFRVLAQTVWLWDEWPRLPAWRRALARRLLRTHEVEALLSDANAEASRREVPDRTVVMIPFGTADTSTAGASEPGDSPEAHVVAPGNDRHRDWALLEEVARLLPETRFSVFSAARAATSRSWPPNVTIETAASVVDLARVYATASAVALPLKPNLHASGITVANEAMSAGTPLVVSDAGGVGPYVDSPGCHLAPVGDAPGFAEALRAAFAHDRDAITERLRSRRRELGLTQQDYVYRYAWLTLWLTGRSELTSHVTAFAPVPRPPAETAADALG